MSSTCHEEGVVTGLLDGGERAQVTVERSEACGRCEAKGACQVLGGQKADLVLVVDNSLGAKEGDRVRLSIEESAVVKASAVLYLIPALGIMGGAGVGYALSGTLGSQGDGSAVIGCLAGLIIGVLTSWLLGKKLSKKSSFIPVLSGITEKDS